LALSGSNCCFDKEKAGKGVYQGNARIN